MKKSKLQHIKSLKNGFKIPEGYFDTVEDAVFAKLSTEELSEKDGFSTPDAYFDTVEDSILKKINQEKDKQSEQPSTLINSQTGYTIPDNYLEAVEDLVLAKLKDNVPQVKVIDFRVIILKRVIPLVAAASLLLFIAINYYSGKNIGFEKVAASEIEQWIEDDLITLDTYEIAEVYSDVELENTTIFAEEELIEYLNGTDVESLLLEN